MKIIRQILTDSARSKERRLRVWEKKVQLCYEADWIEVRFTIEQCQRQTEINWM
jgi:hypothetical protein